MSFRESNFRDLQIGTKLSIGFGVAVLMMLIVIVLGIISMVRINKGMEELVNRTTMKIWYSTIVEDSVHTIDNAILNSILARDQQTSMVEYVRIMTARKTYEGAIEEIEKLEDSQRGSYIIKQMLVLLRQGRKKNDAVIEMVRDGRYEEARDLYLTTYRTPLGSIRQVSSELVSYEKEQGNVNYALALKIYRTTSFAFICIGIIALILSTIAAFILTKSITKPLTNGVNIAEQIGKGNLSVEIDVPYGKGDETVRLLVAMKEMVEKLKKMNEIEHQLYQSQKHETVGRLAGGIAHDFNNILSVIIGNAQLMKMNGQSSQKMLERCMVIEKAVLKASDLIKQLLAFSRKQALELHIVNVNDVVNEFDKMIRRLLNENIDLKIVAHSGLAYTKIDISQMNQVVLNLVVNAKEAMPDGGVLTIETDMVYIDNEFCQGNVDARPGNHVIISVTDTGTGMNRETLDNIFEPFFTTKESGTGLGLSVVYGIVRQHGGFLEVDTEIGKGTRFSVYLPYVDEQGSLEGKILNKDEGAFIEGRGESILVV